MRLVLRHYLSVTWFRWRFGPWTGAIVDANHAYLKLTGHTRGDLEKGAMRCGSLTPDQVQRVGHPRHPRITGRQDQGEELRERYARPDGRRVPVMISSALLPGYRDRGGVVCALDLTRQKTTETELHENRAPGLYTVF